MNLVESRQLLNQPCKQRIKLVAKRQPKRYPITREYAVIYPPERTDLIWKRTQMNTRTPVKDMKCPKGLDYLPGFICNNEKCPWHITAPFYNNCMHHSTYNSDGMTLEEIGQSNHLTRERVRQIELDALEKVKKAMGLDKVEDIKAAWKKLYHARYLDEVCDICKAPAHVPCGHKSKFIKSMVECDRDASTKENK